MSALRQPTPPTDAPPVAALPATPRVVLDAIRGAYIFADSADESVALGILSQRPDIASVLLEALPHVYASFGDGTGVRLDVLDEHSSEPIRFGARIVSAAASPESRIKLVAFYTTWWNDASRPVLGELSFGLTYA